MCALREWVAARRSHEERVAAVAELGRQRVAELVVALERHVGGGEPAAISSTLARLVGLGPGLTPSGDDALVGFLAALWALTGSGGSVAAAVMDATDSATRTSYVSMSYLRLAAAGLFAEPLRTLAASVAAGDPDATRAAARLCWAQGSTSGSDGIGGLLAGCSASIALQANIQGRPSWQ